MKSAYLNIDRGTNVYDYSVEIVTKVFNALEV